MPIGSRVFYFGGVFAVAAAAAVRAGYFHVRQKLHVKVNYAGAVAGWAAQFAGVVRKIACFKAERFGVFRSGKNFA